MKRSLKKRIVGFGMCLAAAAALMSTTAMAGYYQNNNIDFSFRIQGSVDNAQESIG